MEDIFDSFLNLEEIHLKEGFNEGYKEVLVSRREEAMEVGLKRGFEFGEELGFYRGCVDVWKLIVRVNPAWFSYHIQKGIKQMEELIEEYPFLDPENKSVQEIMGGFRLKFKVICASMGAKLDYNGYPKSFLEAKEIEFCVDSFIIIIRNSSNNFTQFLRQKNKRHEFVCDGKERSSISMMRTLL